MPSLSIAESGMSFVGPAKQDSAMPTALSLTLTDGVIEEMIKCVQNGKPIQLSLGELPKISYGAKTQLLSTSPTPFTHELYRSSSKPEIEPSNHPDMARTLPKPDSSGARKDRPQFAFMFGSKGLSAVKPLPATMKSASTSSSSTKNTSVTIGNDAALADLKSQMASESARKAGNTTKLIKDVPKGKGAAAKLGSSSKHLSGPGRPFDAARSMPSSPNLSGIASPSSGPTSIPRSQQQAEQAKATRKPFIHLLALRPMAENELKKNIPDISNVDFRQALEKVGDLNDATGKWELRKLYYKELDVFTFRYQNDEDRQRAIENTVKQYDKLRMGVSEPEWDRLLPRAERGTGKCLSKLQAQIAQGTAAKTPKIHVQRAEDSGRDTPVGHDVDESSSGGKKSNKSKGENPARSGSQPPPSKSKISEREAQAKRLLSKNPTKPKPAPIKKDKPAQKAAAKALSSQFVSDSDEEDHYMVPVKTDLKQKPQPSIKRSREEDVETSDSSVPLSKKVKVKKDLPNHRISDASQSSRTTNSTIYSSASSKTKGNSPQKSSPLASSPPTNASEFDNSSGHTSSSASPAHRSSSSKVSHSPIHKRHQKSSSVISSASSTTSTRSLKPEVIDLARRYRSYYPKYYALYEEVSSFAKGGRRDTDKEDELLDMHQRLSTMRATIDAGIIEV